MNRAKSFRKRASWRSLRRTRRDMRLLLPFLALANLFGAPDPLDQITSQALLHSRAYSFIEELCDRIGPRLTGSAEADRAAAWAVRTMQSISLQNVHLEKWQLDRSWRRGLARAE